MQYQEWAQLWASLESQQPVTGTEKVSNGEQAGHQEEGSGGSQGDGTWLFWSSGTPIPPKLACNLQGQRAGDEGAQGAWVSNRAGEGQEWL